MYKGYVSRLVVAWSLVIPHVRHAYVLLPLTVFNVRHVHLGLQIWVSLKAEQLVFGLLVVVLLVLLQWNVLGSNYHLVYSLFYNC